MIYDHNIQTVDLVSDLIALAPVDGQICNTLGYGSAGVGANSYRYEASSVAVCDGGFILDGIAGSNTSAETSASYAGTGTGRFTALDQSRASLDQFGAGLGNAASEVFRLAALSASGASVMAADYPLYMIWTGQSNANGADDPFSSNRDPIPGGVEVWTLSNTWETWDLDANPAQIANVGIGRQNIGLHFAHGIHQATGRKVRVITATEGGVDISEWITGGPKWTEITVKVAAAGVTEIEVLGWHQGENDSGRPMVDYKADFDAVIAQLVGESWWTDNSTFVAGELARRGVADGQNEFFDVGVFELEYAPQNVFLAQTADYRTSDGTHFQGDLMEEIGKRAYTGAWRQRFQHASTVYGQHQLRPPLEPETGLAFGAVGDFAQGAGTVDFGLDDFTIEVDYRINADPAGFHVINRKTSGGVTLSFTSDVGMELDIGAVSIPLVGIADSGRLYRDAQVHRMTLVCDRDSYAKVYIDGILAGIGDPTPAIATVSSGGIRVRPQVAGDIYGVATFNYARGAAEVTEGVSSSSFRQASGLVNTIAAAEFLNQEFIGFAGDTTSFSGTQNPLSASATNRAWFNLSPDVITDVPHKISFDANTGGADVLVIATSDVGGGVAGAVTIGAINSASLTRFVFEYTLSVAGPMGGIGFTIATPLTGQTMDVQNLVVETTGITKKYTPSGLSGLADTGWNSSLPGGDTLAFYGAASVFGAPANRKLMGSVVHNPASLLDGGREEVVVAVDGAAFGDFAQASFSLGALGVDFKAQVSGAGFVLVTIQNETGATVDLASGTITVKVSRL